MLRVNNKTISFARGENIAFSIEIKDGDGNPFIFPVLSDTAVNYEKFLVFSVVNEYGEKVIEKILDISGPIAYLNSNNEYTVDYSELGYAKFSSQKIETVEDVNDFYGYTKGVDGNIQTAENENRLKVIKNKNNYFCWASNNENAISSLGEPVIYKFIFTLNLLPEDTINLRIREYKYDLVACIKSPSETVWRRQLIMPSSLILEDSNNGY